MLKILGAAPACIPAADDGRDEAYIFGSHIDSYLAPVALNILAANVFRNYKGGSGRKEKEQCIVWDGVEEAWKRIVDVLDKRGECLNQLLPLFKEIDEMPILVLQSIDMLHNNKMDLKKFLSDEDYFLPIIRRAGQLAVGRKEYEWVGKWIKGHVVKLIIV